MIPEKIVQLLKSGQNESIWLAESICKEKYPALWSAMMHFVYPVASVQGTAFSPTKSDPKEKHAEVCDAILKNHHMNIGDVVRFKGMDNCPNMVVTIVEIKTMQTILGQTFCTFLTARYYNKSAQSFVTVSDRFECFEKIEKQKDEPR